MGTRKKGFKSSSFRHIQTKAPNRHTLRGFVVSGSSPWPAANGRTPLKQRSPRYKARADAHFCKVLFGANSLSSGALFAVSLGKFLSGEWGIDFSVGHALFGQKNSASMVTGGR
ncbi:hypothetical protein [Pseudomonas sediminis]|uniref:hypothetical protein n=1 Tax=Pseudomonas sediminis TaxID=1691904 RepID=UPI00117BA0B5|nr:hypothetical protein [Pseudomonas sediminis]